MEIDPEKRALSLKEAAALLGVSYRTVFDHKESLGFFQVGSAWRVWPDTLREATEQRAKAPATESVHQAPSPPPVGHAAGMSARQAAAELDKLLAAGRPKTARVGRQPAAVASGTTAAPALS